MTNEDTVALLIVVAICLASGALGAFLFNRVVACM